MSSSSRIIRVLLSVEELVEFGVGDIDYAMVVLNSGRIQRIMRQMKEIGRRKDVDYFHVFDYSPYWLGNDEDLLRSALLGSDAVEDAARVDCEQRVTSNNSVFWTGSYKHTSVKFETDVLTYEDLQELRQVAEGKKEMIEVGPSTALTVNLDFINELNITTR